MSDQFLLLPRILNSAIAGVIASCLVYPLDLVKTRFQTQVVSSSSGVGTYKSVPDAFLKIHKHEGFLGLYRGLPISVLFVTPELITNIAGNDFFRNLFQPPEGIKHNLPRQTLAAACTGCFATLIATPMEFIKIQLQDEGRLKAEQNINIISSEKSVDSNALRSKHSKNAKHLKDSKHSKLTGRQVIKNVLRKRGFFGLFQGVVPCAMRDVPFAMLYFPLFAVLYDCGPVRPDGEATYAWSLTSGLISGSITAFLLTPCDVVKTRMQTLHPTAFNSTNLTVWDNFQSIYKNEGFRAFYRGAGLRMLVIAPLFGITEMIYYFGVAEYLLNLPTQTFVR